MQLSLSRPTQQRLIINPAKTVRFSTRFLDLLGFVLWPNLFYSLIQKKHPKNTPCTYDVTYQLSFTYPEDDKKQLLSFFGIFRAFP